MESGKFKEVSQAVKQVGISRSTYYKYKDYIFEPSDLNSSRKAVFSMMLDHAPGVLSALLACISECGASVLTITQHRHHRCHGERRLSLRPSFGHSRA